MATEVITLPKIFSDEPSLDFEGLRQQGIDAIQRMGGRLWTDFNSHDPGVTILEVLAYAIMDLGYRTTFEVADLLSPAPDAPPPLRNFYTLAEVATMKALTVNDYRRLLVDLPGIRNAWVELAKKPEVDIWLNAATSSLSYWDPSADLERVRLGGLLDVLLEFEEDPKWGDLNDNSLIGNFTIAMPGATVKLDLEFEFPIWEEMPADFEGATLTALSSVVVTPIPGEEFGYIVTLTLAGLSDPMNIYIRAASNLELLPSTLALADGLRTFLPGDDDVLDLILHFQAKRAYTHALCKTIHAFLLQHRNLCEDFVQVQPINVQEIHLDLELEILPLADADNILAHTYFQTELHLSPPIRFQSLEELLDMGRTTAEIFDGPLLQHGFIDEQTLRKHQRRRVIHTSDLLQLYMDIPGVVAVNRLLLSNSVRGTVIGRDAADCLLLTAPERFVPRLSFRRTRVTFERGDNYPLPADELKAQQLLSELKALQGARRDSAAILDMPEPFGNYRDTDEYLSIQEDFPRVYGIGSPGLPLEADTVRRGRAKQLKGFLLFFDQLLANYLSQLTNLRRLFALEEPVDVDDARTYFAHDLYTVPEVQNLLKDFITTYGTDWTAAEWTGYADENSPYLQAVRAMLETRAGYLERRTQFQGHLLARFSERFTDYALWLWSHDASTAAETLVQDTSLFLDNYPSVSAERAAAFNYCPAQPVEVWETDNVSGLEKRVSRLLGLQHVDRFRLSSVWDNFTFTVIGMGPGMYFEVVDDSSVVLLRSGNYSDENEAYTKLEDLLEAARVPSQCVVVNLGAGANPWQASIRYASGTIIARSQGQTTEAAAQTILATALELLAADNHEGFHVVEKILLRPMAEGDPFLHVFLDPNCADPELVTQWGYLLPVDPDAELPAYNLDDSPPENPNMNTSQGPVGDVPDPIEGGSGNGGMGAGGSASNGRMSSPKDAGNGGSSGSGAVPTAEGLPSIEDVNTAGGAQSPYASPSTVQPEPNVVCECCDCLKIKDPYSFRVCIIAPDWTPKFRDKNFRRLFRETVRREMPAHIFANFYFLNRVQMRDFETAYSNWSHWKAYDTRERLDIAHDEDFDPTTDIVDDALETLLGGCDAMCNGYDAEYIVAPLKKTNVYTPGDVVAYIVDADGVTVDAQMAVGSDLPDGLALHPFTGDIIVTDPALFEAGEDITLDIVTRNSSGEKHCHHLTFTWPTDQEAICVHGDGELASSYEDGDVLLSFSDPDGAIVEYWFSPDPLPLPAGMEFDETTGEITVTDASLLRPVHNWPVRLTTVDENGGTTYHDCVLNLLADTPAEADVFVNCSTGSWNLVKGMRVFRVTDIDGGVASVAPDGVAFALLGLRVEIEVARPFPVAVFYLEDPALFQSYILAHSSEVAGSTCRSFDLDLIVTDVAGAVTALTVTLAFRQGTAPTVTVTTPKNVISYANDDELAVVRNTPDGGIASLNNHIAFATAGISAEHVADRITNEMIVSLRVSNAEAFKAQVQGQWATSGGNFVRTFQLTVTNALGATNTVSIPLVVNPNAGPSVDTLTDKSYGTLADGDELVELEDASSGGITEAVLRGIDPSYGLSVAIVPITGPPASSKAVVSVDDAVQLRKKAREEWERDEDAHTYSRRFIVETTNGLDVVHSSYVLVQIDDAIADSYELLYAEERPDEMYAGMVLARWQSTAPDDYEVTVGTLPPGMAFTYSDYELRLVVDDAAEIKQGTYDFEVTLLDVEGDEQSYELSLEIPARQLDLRFGDLRRGNQDVPWTDLYPGLTAVVFDAPVVSRYGLVSVDGENLALRMYAVADRAFDPIVVTFEGELEYLDAEPVVGTLTLSAHPNLFSVGYQSLMAQMAPTLALASEPVKTIATQVGDFLRLLDQVAYFDTTLSQAEWADRLADYRAGDYDAQVAEQLGIRQSVALLQALRRPADRLEVQANLEFVVLGAMLRFQVEALAFYTGELRTGDIPTSGPLAALYRLLTDLFTSLDRE